MTEFHGPRRERLAGDGAETSSREPRLLEPPEKSADGLGILRSRQPYAPAGRREARADNAAELVADFETSGVAEPEYDFRAIPSFGPGLKRSLLWR